MLVVEGAFSKESKKLVYGALHFTAFLVVAAGKPVSASVLAEDEAFFSRGDRKRGPVVGDVHVIQDSLAERPASRVPLVVCGADSFAGIAAGVDGRVTPVVFEALDAGVDVTEVVGARNLSSVKGARERFKQGVVNTGNAVLSLVKDREWVSAGISSAKGHIIVINGTALVLVGIIV